MVRPFRTVHAVSSWREPIDLGRLVLGVHFKSRCWALTDELSRAPTVCDVCRCASMCILFEQLNINNDVFNQVSVVLFLYSAVKTARQARCVTLICETQINVASRLLDVSTMPPYRPMPCERFLANLCCISAFKWVCICTTDGSCPYSVG